MDNELSGSRDMRNQADVKRKRDRGGKGLPSSKVANAEKKKMSQEEFLQNFPDFQFNRALEKIFDGTATPEDCRYIDQSGDKVKEFITKRGNRVTITVVDFTRENK